jgi:hypothetical protein
MRLKGMAEITSFLDGVAPDSEEPTYGVIEKAEDQRITMGVMYAPGMEDAQGEYAEAGDLEKAVHDYMARGDLAIRRQHGKEIIGSIVGIMAWPFETEMDLKSLGAVEKSSKVKLPAGTVFATAQWTKEAWPLVKSGAIRGFSMGGRAVRVHE